MLCLLDYPCLQHCLILGWAWKLVTVYTASRNYHFVWQIHLRNYFTFVSCWRGYKRTLQFKICIKPFVSVLIIHTGSHSRPTSMPICYPCGVCKYRDYSDFNCANWHCLQLYCVGCYRWIRRLCVWVTEIWVNEETDRARGHRKDFCVSSHYFEEV